MATKGFFNAFDDIWMLDGMRTPMVDYCGALGHISPTDLGIKAARAALEKAGVPAAHINSVLTGNMAPGDFEQFMLPRHIGLYAGVPQEVPALMAQRICGTGFELFRQAGEQIQAGCADVALVVGAESVARAPVAASTPRTGYQLGAPVGFLAANGLFLLLGLWLGDADFLSWGWRVPFLASALLVAIGLWVRLNIEETPAFRAALEAAPPPAVPLWRLLQDHWAAVLAGSAGVVACFSLFYLSTAFALDIGTRSLGYAREHFLALQLGANLFLALGIVLAAWWADKTSARRVLLWGALATIAVGFGFGPGLASGSGLAVFVTLAAALFTMGFVYGPLGGWLPTLYPVPVRYSGVSVAFNAGGILGGAVTPLAAKALSNAGMGGSIGLLLVGAGALTLLGVSLARPAST